MSEKSLRGRLRLGYIVFGVLVGVKVVEYFISAAVRGGTWPYLAVLALVGAWCILYYFMHIGQLWRPGGKDDK